MRHRNFRGQSGRPMRVPQGGPNRASGSGKFKCCCGPNCKPTCFGFVTSGMGTDEANCDCCQRLVSPDGRR